MSTLPDILKNSAVNFPNKAAVVLHSRSVSYKDLDAQTNAVANYLLARGIKKGDRVGIFLERSLEEVISLWGIAKAGGIFVNIEPRLTPDQVSYRIENCGMRYVISSEKKRDALREDGKTEVINTKDFDFIIEHHANEPPGNAGLSENDLAAILYTSGSTGYPKGAVLNHGNLVLGTRIVAQYLGNTQHDVIISALPFCFDYGLNQMFTAFFAGGTLVLQASMFPGDICKTLIEQRITGFAGIPTTWVMLLQDISPFKKSDFPHLRYITNSGGMIPARYLNELKKVLKKTKIYLMYGLTEAFRSTYLPPEEIDHRPTSIGKAIPGVQVAVIDKDGKECQAGEEGMLVHRGGVIFQGYWNDPEETNKVLKPFPLFPGGPREREMAVWSNDIVKKDEEGFLYFIGRNDEMIKCLGHRISPQEIEDVLYKMEQIEEAVVFGITDDLWGQKIKAVVSLKEKNGRISKKEVIDFCKTRLPDFMMPREIEFAPSLPKTPAGKIDRARVKEEHKGGPVHGLN
jgi:acyl-CoA ligase (AMP-forming) (exosortase A-associated)